MSNVSVMPDTSKQIARPLRVLVPLIKDDLEHAEKAGMPYYRAAGEKMIEAKAQMGHGEFKPWIERNFSLSFNRASIYMNFASATSGKQNLELEIFQVSMISRKQRVIAVTRQRP